MTEATTSTTNPPRVTLAAIEAAVAAENYFTAADGAHRVTDSMVNRFLGWKLPVDFDPDAGISFKAVYNENSPCGPSRHEPVGTNLLSAEQARAMLEHVLQPQPCLPALNILTLCILTLRNGFTIVGKSACASPALFNEEIGRKIAREDAIRQAWPLLGYELRSKLASGG